MSYGALKGGKVMVVMVVVVVGCMTPYRPSQRDRRGVLAVSHGGSVQVRCQHRWDGAHDAQKGGKGSQSTRLDLLLLVVLLLLLLLLLFVVMVVVVVLSLLLLLLLLLLVSLLLF